MADHSLGSHVLAGAVGDPRGAGPGMAEHTVSAAVGWWTQGMSVLLFAFLQAALVFFLVLRWIARRNGGWRRTWWLLGQEARLTRRAFLDPVRDFRRHRAAVRLLTGLLTDPGTFALARAALDDVNRRLAGSGAFAYAVWITPGTAGEPGIVTVRVAARRVPPPAGFWGPAGEGCWEAFADDVLRLAVPGEEAAARADEPARPLVPLGLDGEGLLLADLTASPGMVSVHGDAGACVAFVQTAAAFLDLQAGDVDVLVTRELWHGGPGLHEVIEALDGDRPAPARPVVVVCLEPQPAQTVRLARMAAEGRLRAIVAGPVPGHRWDAHLDARGRLDASGLGIFTEAAPLAPAVAAAIRAGASSPPPVARPSVPRPPVDGPPMSGPPVSGPPVSGPPVSGPPVSGPPVSGPPVSGPPVSGPPVSGPPVSGPPVPGPPVPGPPVPEPAAHVPATGIPQAQVPAVQAVPFRESPPPARTGPFSGTARTMPLDGAAPAGENVPQPFAEPPPDRPAGPPTWIADSAEAPAGEPWKPPVAAGPDLFAEPEPEPEPEPEARPGTASAPGFTGSVSSRSAPDTGTGASAS